MPKISLVVCLYKERDLLERLLQHAEGCYDDLVVVHDGPEEGDPNWKPGPPSPGLALDWACVPPDAPLPEAFQKCQSAPKPGSLREFVEKKGGRFYEHPRVGSLEGQSPFAWWAAKHDWILRLDADEFPSEEMKQWLSEFRSAPEPPEEISGYTCIWPPWNGKKETSRNIPEWRPFFICRKRFSFFGLVEQGPVPDVKWQTTGLILHHIPRRKSYGAGNLILRKQAYIWRKVIAASLMNTPLQLPRWRWSSENWPPYWEEIRNKPISAAIKRFLLSVPREYRFMRRNGYDFLPEAALGTALHKFLIPVAFWFHRSFSKND